MTAPNAAAEVIVFAAVAAVVAAVARFELLCFRELAATSDSRLRHLTRPGWIAVIACAIPVGGVLFLYCGRTQ